jgi:hypothetical protein
MKTLMVRGAGLTAFAGGISCRAPRSLCKCKFTLNAEALSRLFIPHILMNFL